MLQSLKASKDTVATDAFSWIEELSTSPDATMWKFTQLHDAQQVALLQQLSQVDAMKLTKTIEALPASQQEHLALAVRRSPLAAAAGGPPSSWVAALQAQSGSLDASVASKNKGLDGATAAKGGGESREGAMLAPYPGYDGPLKVTGKVGASYDVNSDFAEVWFNLAGLEAESCKTAPEGVANACGIHIHEGGTCSDAAQVGGHYYEGDTDPWLAVTYSSKKYGKAKGEIGSISIGNSLDISGRAMVVHDSTGARVACALLPEEHSPPRTMLGLYPGYDGTLNVTGYVGASYIGVSARVSFSLDGLEAEKCETTPAGVANACGIHIHKGETCSDAAQVGGHYFEGDTDPWESVTYSGTNWTSINGEIDSINIGSGLDISGRALVVHDSTGARVACGQLPLYTGNGPSFCGARTVKQDEAAGVKLQTCNRFISGPDCGHEVFGDNAFGECKTEDSPTRLRICNTLNNTDACAASSITSLETCAAKVREMVDAGLCHEYGQFYTSFYLSSTPAKPSCVCRYPSTTMGEVKVTGAKNSLLWALA